MILIDGSFGEGGGQIIRSSLALSLITGSPVRIEQIRAGRARSGLRRQHLTAARAAAEVGKAELSGARVGASAITFVPRDIVPGEYHFDVGTAGSTTLVLQTVLPALILARGPSRLVLEGGTHNPFAPPFDFIEKSFLPLLRRMGPSVDVTLERAGFFPKGGGRFVANIRPVERLERLDLLGPRGAQKVRARALVAGLPSSIARRELKVVAARTGERQDRMKTEVLDEAWGPGNVLFVEVETDELTEVFTGFGEKGVPAERVAGRAADRALRYLESSVSVGEYLADQLLLPMALAGGGSFSTHAPSDHTKTHAHIIQKFLPDVRVDMREEGDRHIVTVSR